MTKEKLNILLISVDTLRADHLGCYGYAHNTSPNIDSLANRGVLFDRFFCGAIPTQPSYTTLYTGQDPVRHGVVAQGGKAQLAKNAPFLPQMLLSTGYTTCAVDNLLQERIWFGRGFEFYIDPSVRRSLLLGISCEELNERAIPWILQHSSEPFFMHIHYWDPHWPLKPPGRYKDLFYDQDRDPFDPSNRGLEPWWSHPLGQLARSTWLRRSDRLITDPDYVVALYDQEIRYLDDGLGALLAALDEAGIAENTMVVLLADHGESMTEHGIFFAHHGLYDPVIRAPLIARLPGVFPEGVRSSAFAQHQDVAPTLLEAAGAAIPRSMDGYSLWNLMTGQEEDGKRASVICCECSWQANWCLRNDHHKFILARSPDLYGSPPRKLYNLREDPAEEHNLVQTEPSIAAKMEAELEDWIGKRIEQVGRQQDPLIEEGVSLGKGFIKVDPQSP